MGGCMNNIVETKEEKEIRITIAEIKEVEKIINDLRQQIPNLQAQLNQAEGLRTLLKSAEKEVA
jgi:hypothetical protein